MFEGWFFLLGPTGIGKHRIALKIARRIGAEIISVDSMKVYREMDIGTAKPSPEARAEIPHHLIDILDPSERYNAARFVRDACLAREDIIRRGKVPLFVGGTALYYRALVYGIFEGINTDQQFRQELIQIANRKGSGYLHAMLSEFDPQAASKIHPNDLRRIVRALEVYKKSGKPISSLQTHSSCGIPAKTAVLWCERETLRSRIQQRVDQMIRAGLVEEVARLARREKGWSNQAKSALGYREILQHLQRELTLKEAVKKIQINTARFAKRQMMWFRGFSEANWVEAPEDESDTKIVGQVLSVYDLG